MAFQFTGLNTSTAAQRTAIAAVQTQPNNAAEAAMYARLIAFFQRTVTPTSGGQRGTRCNIQGMRTEKTAAFWVQTDLVTIVSGTTAEDMTPPLPSSDAFALNFIGTPAAANTAVGAMTVPNPTAAKTTFLNDAITTIQTEITALGSLNQVQVYVSGALSDRSTYLDVVIDKATPVNNRQLVHLAKDGLN